MRKRITIHWALLDWLKLVADGHKLTLEIVEESMKPPFVCVVDVTGPAAVINLIEIFIARSTPFLWTD